MFFMWDDHEVQNNWSEGMTGRYLTGRAAYEEYPAQVSPPPRVPGELYYSFAVGDVEFYVLDTRSHRSPNLSEDGPEKTLLGRRQRNDLFDWLERSTAVFKFIVSSVPFNDWARAADDAWSGERDEFGGFRTERDQIFEFIRQQDIPGVILLSGDQHWAGVFRLRAAAPYVLYEFMPSPLAIKTLRMTNSNDAQILFRTNESNVFGLFDVDSTRSPARLRFRLLDDRGQELYDLGLNAEDIGR